MPMTSAPDLAGIAHALASDARAAMVLGLLDGRAWTLTELARAAGTGLSTTSDHADRLLAAGLLEEVRQGRHRYLRIAGPRVAEAVESLAALTHRVQPAQPSLVAQRADRALREGRSCYRHLAGRLGVSLCDGARRNGYVAADWTLSQTGRDWMSDRGVKIPAPADRPILRPCLDWTERREHLAGVAADELFAVSLARGWIARATTGRAVRLTPAGRVALAEVLDPG